MTIAHGAVRPALRAPARGRRQSPRAGLSATLSKYLARQALAGIGLALLGLAVLALAIDFVELARRASDEPDATLGVVALMSGLHLPFLVQELLPFAVLFGTMLSCHRLTRSQELIAVRASGLSIWQLLLPALSLALGIGAFAVLALNPLAATLVARFETLDRTYLSSGGSQLALAPGGLWLREARGPREFVLHGRRMTDSPTRLEDVMVFVHDEAGRFLSRLDAPMARLRNGYWHLEHAVRTAPDGQRAAQTSLRLATELTPDRIHESFAPPETLGFWDLPDFVASLKALGFSAREHQLYWHRLLALPLVLCAMLLIGTSCSLRLVRLGGTGVLVAGGLFVGFLFFILSDLMAAVGLSGRVPTAMAAWAPAGIAVLLGITTLLHLEDG